MSPLNWILKEKLVAILRGVPAADMNEVVQALFDGGIRVLEITLNSEDALNLIANIENRFRGRMLVGAGTVLDARAAESAAAAGAHFLISPGFDPDVVSFAKSSGLVAIPGAFTPTEILNAYRAGADIVKVFPVNNAEYIKNVAAPLNHIPLMPTGGINTKNIVEFSNAGAVAFGIGSALAPKTTSVDDAYLADIRQRAALLVSTVATFKR
jgi:2-dehydro-3-deoxyphosphogluconate aldolase/(4S)-4-hydroxy-2-oxoglutarate aldolase